MPYFDAWGVSWGGSWGKSWGHDAGGTVIEVYNPVALVPAGHWKHLFKRAFGVTTPEVREERASAWRVAVPEAKIYSVGTETPSISAAVRCRVAVKLPYLGTRTAQVGEECHAAFRVVAPRCFAKTGFVRDSKYSLWNVVTPFSGCRTSDDIGVCRGSFSVLVPKTVTNPSAEILTLLVM